MPTTIDALIIILFAILPGVPAHKIYRLYMGKDWKETEVDKIVSIIGFSVGGLLAYIFLSSLFHLPPPIYIFPTTFDLNSFGVSSLLPIAISLFGHFILSAIVAGLTVISIRFFSRWSPSSPYHAAWDDFNRTDVKNHWVVVHLTNGEVYAGMITYADISVGQSDRDIVLGEPAQFVKDENNYKVLQYQQLFLPAALISSIGVVHDPDIDIRVSKIGSNLFPERIDNV
jgi:hypothetical protein